MIMIINVKENVKDSFLSESSMRLKKYSKSLSWAVDLNELFNVMGGKFKFSTKERDLEYFFEPHQTFW